MHSNDFSSPTSIIVMNVHTKLHQYDCREMRENDKVLRTKREFL